MRNILYTIGEKRKSQKVGDLYDLGLSPTK